MKDEIKYEPGKNPNSRNGFKRKYSIDNLIFSKYNKDSCYWAGFIAADGYIDSDYKTLNLTVAHKDYCIIDKFSEFSSSTYPILTYLAKGQFETNYIHIRSRNICNDLHVNFNICTKKSLVLTPPNIIDVVMKDCFICGYIDGDGSIGLYKGPRQNYISIGILGTFEVISWIRERFESILSKPIKNIVKKYNNCYNLQLTDKNARIIFLHYYNLQIPKLGRKWSSDKFQYAMNYRKMSRWIS